MTDRHLHRSRALAALVIGIPLVVAFFVVALLLQQRALDGRDDRIAALEGEVANLTAQNAFYRKAYEITLDDIRQLSTTVGGEERYNRLADELRDDALGDIGGNATVYEVRNTQVWSQYLARGVVDVSCLGETTRVDTIQDEVLLSFTLKSDTPQQVSLYINGNYLTALDLGEGLQTVAVSARIPSGQYEMDLITKIGGLILDTLQADGTGIPVTEVIADTGKGWAVFDCQETTQNVAITAPGALRLSIYKA